MRTPLWDACAAPAIGAQDWVSCTRGRGTDLRYPLSRVSGTSLPPLATLLVAQLQQEVKVEVGRVKYCPISNPTSSSCSSHQYRSSLCFHTASHPLTQPFSPVVFHTWPQYPATLFSLSGTHMPSCLWLSLICVLCEKRERKKESERMREKQNTRISLVAQSPIQRFLNRTCRMHL